MVNQLNSLKELETIVSSNKFVLVDCYAVWCGPCKMIAPIIEEISEEDKDFSFYKVDVDQAMEIASAYQIMSIPTLLIFKDGKLINQLLGFRPKQSLVDILNSIK